MWNPVSYPFLQLACLFHPSTFLFSSYQVTSYHFISNWSYTNTAAHETYQCHWKYVPSTRHCLPFSLPKLWRIFESVSWTWPLGMAFWPFLLVSEDPIWISYGFLIYLSWFCWKAPMWPWCLACVSYDIWFELPYKLGRSSMKSRNSNEHATMSGVQLSSFAVSFSESQKKLSQFIFHCSYPLGPTHVRKGVRRWE